jgi:hypothetical protein
MSVLRTDFAGAFNSGLFTKTETSGTVTQTGGEIVFDGTDAFVQDLAPADISADNATIEISSYPAANNDYRFFFGVIDAAGRGVGWQFASGGLLRFCKQSSGTPADLANAVAGSIGGWSTTYMFVRIRNSGTDSYLEYSTDDVTYTGINSQSYPSGFSSTACKVIFGNMSGFNSSIYKVTNYWAPALSATTFFRPYFITG